MSHDHREIDVRALGNYQANFVWSIVLFMFYSWTIIDEMSKVNANFKEKLNEASSCNHDDSFVNRQRIYALPGENSEELSQTFSRLMPTREQSFQGNKALVFIPKSTSLNKVS
jgi:hypothetical protein